MRVRIEELAERSGVSTRNIRAYQQRGLLPPPELDGRTGYYGDEHLVRLRLIDQLQEQGFSLAAIERTLDAWARGGQLSHLLGFDNVLLAPFSEEESQPIDLETLFSRFPEGRDDPSLLQRAIELDLIEAHEDGSFTVPSPMVLDAGEVLVSSGVPLARLLDLVAGIREDVTSIADRFVRLVADDVLTPRFDAEDADAESQVEALRTVEQLRPIALEVIRPFLARALERRIDAEVATLGLEDADPDGAGVTDEA